MVGKNACTTALWLAHLHHPPARQEHEALLGPRVLDDLQPDAVPARRFGSLLVGVAPVHVGELYTLARGHLHRTREFFHLRPILLGGRRDPQRQQMAQSVHGRMYLRAPLLRFAPS